MIKRIERADGARYQVYSQRNGRKVYVGTYASRREAAEQEEEHRVTQRKIERGELPPEVDLGRTLAQAVEAWFRSLEKRGSRSLRPYREFMRAQVLPSLGSVPVARMTKNHVLRWRDECATRYAPTTVNSALGCLSSAFSDFVDRGWVQLNPCRGVKTVEVPDRAYNWIRTVPEMERLLLACQEDLRDMVAIALGTGLRLDELLHLAWDDVDLRGRLLTIQRGRQGTPKRGMRHVPILDAVLPVLQARALRRAGSFLVFPTRTGKVRAKPQVTKAYKGALKRAGADLSLRWHDLRHTFASHWVLGGGDIFRLSRMLGHSSVRITQKTYAHLAPEAWQQDYHRVAFRVPSEPAKLYELPRDERGRLMGKRAVSAPDATTDHSQLGGRALAATGE